MAIEVHCGHCGKAMRVVDTMAGSYGRCLCGNPIYIPRPFDESDELGPVPIGHQSSAEGSTEAGAEARAEPDGDSSRLDPLDALLEEELSPAATGETSSSDPWSRFTSRRRRKRIQFRLSTSRWSIRSALLIASLVAAAVVGLGLAGYYLLSGL